MSDVRSPKGKNVKVKKKNYDNDYLLFLFTNSFAIDIFSSRLKRQYYVFKSYSVKRYSANAIHLS